MGYGGAVGAAAAVLVGELLLLVLAWRALKPAFPVRRAVRPLLEPGLSASVMAMVILPLRSEPLYVPILAGMGVYLGLAWLYRSRLLAAVAALDLHSPAKAAYDAESSGGEGFQPM